jgi:hypothetical protein
MTASAMLAAPLSERGESAGEQQYVEVYLSHRFLSPFSMLHQRLTNALKMNRTTQGGGSEEINLTQVKHH